MSELLSAQERKKLSTRLGIDLCGGALLIVGLLYGYFSPEQTQFAALIQALAAILVGASSLYRGISGLFQQKPEQTTDQLVALAILASAAMGDFITAVLLPLILDIGRIFEERSAMGAQAAIDAILTLEAERAQVWKAGSEKTCRLDELQVNDVVIVRPGERIPADGIVVEGMSAINQAAISGESRPEEVRPDSTVFAGSQNMSGLLRIRITALGADSALGRVVRLLQESTRTERVRRLERWLSSYFPLALCLAATVLFFTADVSRAITILVVACPAALALSGPATMVAAMTGGARQGFVIKNADALERLLDVEGVAIDKTGTITEGDLQLQTIQTEANEDDILQRAAQCAQISLHPISRALVEAAKERGMTMDVVPDGREESGRGIRCQQGDVVSLLGRKAWLEEEGIAVPDVAGTVFFAQDGAFLASFVFGEQVKDGAADLIREFKAQALHPCILLTGDREEEAKRVAQAVGIQEVYADLLPEDKAQHIEATSRSLLMIGDGMNDALALQKAEVGVAFGRNLSQAAIGGADIAIVNGELSSIHRLLTLARRTETCLVVNIILSLFFGLAMFILASMGILSTLVAALLHNVGALFVLVQSARLLVVDEAYEPHPPAHTETADG